MRIFASLVCHPDTEPPLVLFTFGFTGMQRQNVWHTTVLVFVPRSEKVMTLLCIWSLASLDLSNSVTPPGVGEHSPLGLQGPTFTPLTFILTSILKPLWSYTLTDESPESRWEKKIRVAKNVDIFHLSCLQLLPWAHSSYAKHAAESACGIFFSPPFHLSGYKQAASFKCFLNRNLPIPFASGCVVTFTVEWSTFHSGLWWKQKLLYPS